MAKPRMVVEMTPELERRIDRLKADTESSSRAEVFRRALALLDYVQEIKAAGGKVYTKLPGETTTEIYFL